MNDSTDLHTASLEMKGGLEAGIKYPANYMHAPASAFPAKPPKAEKASINDPAMKMTMGC